MKDSALKLIISGKLQKKKITTGILVLTKQFLRFEFLKPRLQLDREDISLGLKKTIFFRKDTLKK